MPISANQPAPEFSLQDENGVVHNLSDYRGKAVVLYFYPKDDTPGCTVEACNFRDDYHIYAEAGVPFWASAPIHPSRTPNSKEVQPALHPAGG
jgi:thioredoxin-dependent peroxiredoxin